MTSSASSESGVTSRKLIAAALAGALVSAAATSVVVQWSGRRHGRRGKKGKQNRQDDVGSDVEGAERQSQDRRTSIVRGVPGLIGSTPLMRIESLSDMTGCEILVSSNSVMTTFLAIKDLTELALSIPHRARLNF